VTGRVVTHRSIGFCSYPPRQSRGLLLGQSFLLFGLAQGQLHQIFLLFPKAASSMPEREIIYIDSDSDGSADNDVVLISEGSQIGRGGFSRSQSIMSFSGSQATEPPSSQPGSDDPLFFDSDSECSRGSAGDADDMSDDELELKLDFTQLRKEAAIHPRKRSRTSSMASVSSPFDKQKNLI
jgi:hypothetical protein